MSEGEVAESRPGFLGPRLFSLAVQALLPVLLLGLLVLTSEEYRAGLLEAPEGWVMVGLAMSLVALGVLINLFDVAKGKPPQPSPSGGMSYHASRLEIAAFALCFLPAMAVVLLGPQIFLLLNSLMATEPELGSIPGPRTHQA